MNEIGASFDAQRHGVTGTSMRDRVEERIGRVEASSVDLHDAVSRLETGARRGRARLDRGQEEIGRPGAIRRRHAEAHVRVDAGVIHPATLYTAVAAMTAAAETSATPRGTRGMRTATRQL